MLASRPQPSLVHPPLLPTPTPPPPWRTLSPRTPDLTRPAWACRSTRRAFHRSCAGPSTRRSSTAGCGRAWLGGRGMARVRPRPTALARPPSPYNKRCPSLPPLPLLALKPDPKPSCHRRSPFLTPNSVSTNDHAYLKGYGMCGREWEAGVRGPPVRRACEGRPARDPRPKPPTRPPPPTNPPQPATPVITPSG